MKLSFVIPVYNVENYLCECVESILKQCTDECEIILVDDGSTDRSGEICDTYKTVSHIKVVHKTNGGLSSARNAGMKVAAGEYIAFVDSDDRIAAGCVQEILEWIKTTPSDICFLDGIKFYADGTQEPLGDDLQQDMIRNHSKESIIKYLSERPKYPGSACTKIYSRLFLEKNNLHFPLDRRLSEDLGFILDCILQANTYDALNTPYYEYRQNRAGSITNTVTERSFRDLSLFVEESVRKLMLQGKCQGLCETYAMSFAAYEYSILLWRVKELTAAERRSAWKWLKKYRFVLKFGRSTIGKGIYAISRVVGLRSTAFVLSLYKSLQQHKK